MKWNVVWKVPEKEISINWKTKEKKKLKIFLTPENLQSIFTPLFFVRKIYPLKFLENIYHWKLLMKYRLWQKYFHTDLFTDKLIHRGASLLKKMRSYLIHCEDCETSRSWSTACHHFLTTGLEEILIQLGTRPELS